MTANIPPGPSYSDATIKHLEFIQAVVSRLANNSFLMKGWALTVSGAILSFAVSHLSWPIASLGVMPAALFWFLDSYFLWQERLYRELYDEVAKQSGDITAFSMNPSAYRTSCSWGRAFWSLTLIIFYGALTVIGCVVIIASLIHAKVF